MEGRSLLLEFKAQLVVSPSVGSQRSIWRRNASRREMANSNRLTSKPNFDHFRLARKHSYGVALFVLRHNQPPNLLVASRCRLTASEQTTSCVTLRRSFRRGSFWVDRIGQQQQRFRQRSLFARRLVAHLHWGV